MSPYEQIVEDILTILTADVDPADDALRDADTRYADAVTEVNERLAACDKLLHKGHRAEAIQECDREPNLLDAVALLDFPEAAQWGEYVRQFGLAGPPTLRSDIAMDLNDAYTTNSELGDILRQHRMLALARAPLGSRLKVLRQIARQDAGNPIWLEDVRSWERVRHSQLASETEGAVTRSDLAAIAQLEQEIRSEQWLVPPPGAVTKRIADVHRQLRAKQARRQLEAVEKSLTEAYANYDVPQARKLREQWKIYAAVGIAREDDPLLELVTPALDWLAEQDRQEEEQQDYESALADLESALDQGASRHELERLAHAVLRFEPGLTEALEQRLQERFAHFETASRRKTAFVLTSIVMSVLLVAGVTAWAIYSHTQGKHLAGHQKNLAQLIEARRLPEATNYVNDLERSAPGLLQTPEIQDQIKALETATQAEQARRDRFEQLLQDARNDGQSWAGYSEAWRKLRTADELAEKAPPQMRDAEKKELEAIRGEVETRRRQQQTEINDTWLAEFRAWDQRFEQLDRTDMDAIELLLREGETLGKRPQVESVHRDPIGSRLDRLKKDYETGIARQSEAQLLARVSEAVGDRAKYARSLQAYIDRFPQTPRAADFKQVLENELGCWDGTEAWNELSQRWSVLQLTGISATRANELIAEAKALKQQHPGFPAEASVDRVVEFLTPVQARIKSNGDRLEATLIPDLSVPAVKDFLMVLRKSASGPQVRYYFTGEAPKASSRSIKLAHLVDNQVAETRQIEIPRTEVANPPRENAFDWTSPQQRFFDLLVDQVAQVDDTNWETTFFKIIQNLYTEPLMEPILKIELLDRILATACGGSYAVEQGFGPWKALIQKARQDGRLDLAVSWVDPENANASRARDAAQRLLDNMAPLEEASERARQAWQRMLARQPWERYRWGGCLLRDETQKWTCPVPAALAGASGELLVIHGTAGVVPSFTKVGHLAGGRATLTLSGTQVEGRPVFVRIP